MSDQNQKTALDIDEIMVDETLIHDTGKQLTPELHCELFRHMLEHHGMVLLESELVAIVDVVRAEIAEKSAAAKEEIAVTEKLLTERQRVLDAIPGCPEHGSCVPHAIEWIESVKARIAALESELELAQAKIAGLHSLALAYTPGALQEFAQASSTMQARPTGFVKVDHSPEPHKRQCSCTVEDSELQGPADPNATGLQECPKFKPDIDKSCLYCGHDEACHQPAAPTVSRIGTEDDGEIV